MNDHDHELRQAEAGDVGPRISQGERAVPSRRSRGLSVRAIVPNAITAAALCFGLTGIRFATDGAWGQAVLAVVLAGLLDGIDGRIARLLKAQSRFGAELDSLADSLSFGVAPALIIFLWSLQDLPRIGWFAALALALCCMLRLARFNAQIDEEEQPHKSAGFLTGVPAPVGAGLAFLPLYLWMAFGEPLFREPVLVALWIVAIAFLMISNLATLSWAALKPRRSIRIELIALLGIMSAAALLEPWFTLVAVCAIYLALLPYGFIRYRKVKQAQLNASDRGARA
ncbi:CDP-diacylglycerol--serine O-phosphatidyltransferase [Croceicoccus sp. F390]|uniref:CDP-diacylglycerol--serine O-phosphatidyltransferase n=1 Tax=Croceicoccus esteveae TaxID=3075597 RepID=A0ABU2ZIZ1_9SPHN|nr:CDP-diacylglycerol--serine O-phosphatidyltransferase [Croceicoccus sp. F390]MDT0576564.1 CDP-diacylglycerol--serine O-phosphatidyltransferase [Croceicoccus sp. F390]